MRAPRPNSSEDGDGRVNRNVAEGELLARDTIVDAMIVGGGKVQDKAPLARLTLLGDNPKRATLETRNRRSRKRTGNPILGDFKGQVGVDDRRMFRS